MLSLPDSSTGSVRFFFSGIFPYFLLLVFFFTPFHATALPFPKLPGFYETDIFESNRNIFRLSSAHDIHSVLRFESGSKPHRGYVDEWLSFDGCIRINAIKLYHDVWTVKFML